VKPWLPVHPDYKTVNAKAETSNPVGVYAFYKEMIRLRTDSAYASTLTEGRFAPVLKQYGKLIAYTRTEDKKLAVICSLSDKTRKITLPFGVKDLVLSSLKDYKLEGNVLTLGPYQSVTLEIE
jgi:glycosidase